MVTLQIDYDPNRGYVSRMLVPWYCHHHMIIHEQHQGLEFLFPAPTSAPFLSPVPESVPLTPLTSQESYSDSLHSSDIPPDVDAVIDEAMNLASDDSGSTSTEFTQRVWKPIRSPTPATAPKFILSSEAVNGLPVAVPPRQGSPLTTESGLTCDWDVTHDPLQSEDEI